MKTYLHLFTDNIIHIIIILYARTSYQLIIFLRNQKQLTDEKITNKNQIPRYSVERHCRANPVLEAVQQMDKRTEMATGLLSLQERLQDRQRKS